MLSPGQNDMTRSISNYLSTFQKVVVMKKPVNKLLLPLLFITLIATPGCITFPRHQISYTGVDRLGPGESERVDQAVSQFLPAYKYINIALVRNGEIVLTRTYNHNRLKRNDVYASVSKPVTATIVMQLLAEGRITSLDDPVADYAPRYRNAQIDEYADSLITFRHLLSHTSGVPHLSRLWEDDKLIMDFKPGTGVQYSSNGYGILGEVMSNITGKSYRELVQEYIGKPVNATSITSDFLFQAPSGRVTSTIDDMALFGIGVMNGQYFSTDLLYDQVFKRYAEDSGETIGLGWYLLNLDDPDNLAAYHAGSNGRPRAFLAIRPKTQHAVAITGMNRSSDGAHDFGALTIELMGIIRNR